MRVAVGCPIRDRAWIFPEWVEHVRVAFEVAGLTPIWVFAIGVGPNGSDDGTQRAVTDLYKTDPGIWTEISEPDIPDKRHWDAVRYQQMSNYRNCLLGLVNAAIKPDYFLSLDSDILVHPTALLCLMETISHKHNVQGVDVFWDAVGGKTFLSEVSSHHTTYASLGPNGGGLRRVNSDGIFPVEIIMAIKLMAPTAYNIQYEPHQFGEDIGWSLNCNKAGLHLGWDGRVSSKHVMNREALNKVDQRVGW